MALAQGSPLPNITTNQTQATTAPSWYTDYLSGLANTGNQAAAGAQYVGATPLQQQAFNQTTQNIGSYQPNLTAATNLATQAGNYDVATETGRFMNPYTQQVVGALGDVGRRNIEQYLAPGATAAATVVTNIQTLIASNATNRGALGASMNSLEYALDNMQTLSTNLADGISRIVDTDYAAETSNLTRTQILQQAATSMLAQANQMPNVILTLLK